MATHSSILAWGSMGLRRVGHDCLTNTRTFTFMREGGLPPQTLTQNLGPLAQLIAYFSKQSDQTTKGWPVHLWTVQVTTTLEKEALVKS